MRTRKQSLRDAPVSTQSTSAYEHLSRILESPRCVGDLGACPYLEKQFSKIPVGFEDWRRTRSQHYLKIFRSGRLRSHVRRMDSCRCIGLQRLEFEGQRGSRQKSMPALEAALKLRAAGAAQVSSSGSGSICIYVVSACALSCSTLRWFVRHGPRLERIGEVWGARALGGSAAPALSCHRGGGWGARLRSRPTLSAPPRPCAERRPVERAAEESSAHRPGCGAEPGPSRARGVRPGRSVAAMAMIAVVAASDGVAAALQLPEPRPSVSHEATRPPSLDPSAMHRDDSDAHRSLAGRATRTASLAAISPPRVGQGVS